MQEALRLSPRDTRSYIWLMIVGMAKFHLGAYGEAVGWLRRSIEANRNHPLAHSWLAAVLARLGAIEEASLIALDEFARHLDQIGCARASRRLSKFR
uniref:hypothetical protein n=1 Tax=Bradyrhizobium sp. Oc8 TaxID=2876780 RepID=UPI0032096E7A